MSEIWKDVVGYEGLYMVSSLGRIKSIGRTVMRKDGREQYVKERIIKPYCNKANGYCICSLSKNGKSIRPYIHIIVAKTFLDNPEQKEQVNHINGIKTDNRVENLEWVTQSENMRHAFDTGLAPRHTKKRDRQCAENGRKGAIKNMKTVVIYDLEGNIFMIKKGGNRGQERISYHGMMYRLYDDLVKSYGEIPLKINPCISNGHKTLKQYKDGVLVQVYKGYPKDYKKTYIYYSYMYNTTDKNGYFWEII